MKLNNASSLADDYRNPKFEAVESKEAFFVIPGIWFCFLFCIICFCFMLLLFIYGVLSSSSVLLSYCLTVLPLWARILYCSYLCFNIFSITSFLLFFCALAFCIPRALLLPIFVLYYDSAIVCLRVWDALMYIHMYTTSLLCFLNF